MAGVLRNDRLAPLCNLENVNVCTQMIAVAAELQSILRLL